MVVGIETNSIYDQPASRGSQLLAALNWAVNSSPTAVRSRVDGNNRGVAGHSMGGGGTLEALSDDTTGTVKAGVPLAPWNGDKTWGEVNEAVLIVGGESDTIASVSSHSIPFYNSLGGPKTYVELNNASHFFPQSTNATTSRAHGLVVQALAQQRHPVHAVHLRLHRHGHLRLPHATPAEAFGHGRRPRGRGRRPVRSAGGRGPLWTVCPAG